MRSGFVFLPLLAFAIGVSMALPAFAQEGAATYKTKCSACHGSDGQGKIGPALKGIRMSADDIAAMLTRGDDSKKPPHKKAMSGLSDADAKAVADFVKTLK
jgi:mono/diheme cytochrome c family protein